MEQLKYKWKRNINISDKYDDEWRKRKKEGKGIFYYSNEVNMKENEKMIKGKDIYYSINWIKLKGLERQ